MNIIADTCFWISLCDCSQKNHNEVASMMELIISSGRHRLLVPHPVQYETLCSEMVKKPDQVVCLTRYFQGVQKVSDSAYFSVAYQLVEQQAIYRKGSASMVDFLIMLMAEDSKNNVKAILTSNGRDFANFCRKHRIPMIDCMEVLKAV